MYDPSRRSLARRILDRCVGWLVEGLFALLRLIGPDRASALGGSIARSLGPYLGVSNVARDNLRRAMPELDAAARARMLREVWDNLGRTATEFPHMDEIAATRTEIVGGEILERIRASGRGAIFFTAHAANWEIAPRVLQQRGVQLNVIYRTLNNPHIDALIQRYRGTGGESIIAKGAPGARETIRRGSHRCVRSATRVRRTSRPTPRRRRCGRSSRGCWPARRPAAERGADGAGAVSRVRARGPPGTPGGPCTRRATRSPRATARAASRPRGPNSRRSPRTGRRR